MRLTDIQQTLIEKIGVTLELKGQRPAVARIIGLLYLADRSELTLEEMAEALHFSKSATSIALNSLLQSNHLEYITHPGDRKRYFRLRVADWETSFLKEIEEITDFNLLLRQVLEARTEETPQYNCKIKELCSFLDYVAKRLPGMLQEWKKEEFSLSK